jgi:haloalkane dehalogenase
LDLKQINLVVHDFGGPIGLLWAVRNLIKVQRIVIMNTFVYSDFSFSLKLFSLIAKIPLLRDWLVSPLGLALMMKGGVVNKKIMAEEVIADYQAPFASAKDRQVLLKMVNRLEPAKLKEIADKLPQLTLPVLIIYGEKDFMLAPIMRRLKRDIPSAFFTPITDCHHFLQEEKADDINRHILEFIKNGKNRLI